MFQSVGSMLGMYSTQFWLAQVPAEPGVDTPGDAAFVFSGPQFFIALVAGLVLAFAFQLLLTNLSVALGISFLGGQSSDSSDDQESGSLGGTIRKIGFAVGLWTLITVSIALLIACFLAVKLSLVPSAGLGAIVGLVIWAAYFSLLVWVSSTTVGSLVGSVVNTATSGFQAVVGTAAAAIGGKAVNDQIVSTAEAAAAAVRRELTSGVDPTSIRETMEDYLGTLRPPELDITKIRGKFEELLNDPELKSVVGSADLRNIDRQTFVDLVSSRTDFSKKDVNRVVDQLEGVWRQVVGQQQKDVNAELLSYLKSARPEDLRSNELSTKLDQLIEETRTSRKAEQQGDTQQQMGMMGQARQLIISTLMGSVMGRSDLSELDVEKVWSQLQTAKDRVTEQTDKLAGTGKALPYSTIRVDVENYLAHAYSWQMTPEKIESEFRNVIYDPAADPGIVRQQLEQLSRDDFAKLLQQRGVFTQGQVAAIAAQAERIRLEVLATVRAAEEVEKTQDLHRRVEYYLRSSEKAGLTSEGIHHNFKPLLEDSDADYDTLSVRLAQFDRVMFVQLLRQRQDFGPIEVESIATELEGTRDRVLVEAQDLQTRLRSESEALQLNVESYLRNTNKAELNPEGIKRDLRILLEDPQAGANVLRARLSQFDRDTLVKLLSQRPDLSEAEVNQVIDQVESVRDSVLSTPQILAGKAKDQYDQATNAIADYLRRTNRAELNPTGIKRDLQLLLNDPKAGSYALRRRLSQMDRETLVQLLSQREDLSQEQVNQIIDQVQESIRSVVKAPQRWATRAQIQVQDFQATLEDYLRNTNKAELNPEGIKRDLQLLLNDPRLGAESLSDRLSGFDRSTVVALLAQRPDMTEEEANRIVAQVESVREQFVEQVRNIQRRIQSVIDSVFARVRDYLNSLDRPELNYDSIKRDVRTLFDDPQAGFDALRDRLGSFNRDTLVAVLSSRDDISEAQANRIIDQVEGSRNSVLQRAERLQQEAQRRVEALRQQAQRQAEETRKAAATAAWWLFGTAIVSAVAAAVGGAIAVTG